MNKRTIIILLIILLLIGGLVLTIYLALHRQNLKSKAGLDTSRITFLDASGNEITTTASRDVRLKLTYVQPVASASASPSPDASEIPSATPSASVEISSPSPSELPSPSVLPSPTAVATQAEVLNPSFEEDGNPAQGSSALNWNTAHFDQAPLFVRSNEKAHTGNWSLLGDNTHVNLATTTFQNVPIKPNTTYVLSVWVNSESPARTA